MTARNGSSESVLRTSFADGIPDPYVAMRDSRDSQRTVVINSTSFSPSSSSHVDAFLTSPPSYLEAANQPDPSIPDAFASSIAAALAAAAAAAAWDLPSGSIPPHLQELHVNVSPMLSFLPPISSISKSHS